MPLHPQARNLVDMMETSGLPPLYESSVDEARERVAMIREMLGSGPEIDVEDVRIPAPDGQVPARLYKPSADAPALIVYLHGGGWVVGGLDDFDTLCRAFAHESGCQLLSVDYRLAPEHPFPAAAEDAYEALVWAAEHRADGRPIVVAGDSAGGNLAAVCALRARDRGAPELAAQVLVYPVADHDFETGSYNEYAEGYLLGKADMEWFWNHYAPNVADRDNPDASPLRASDFSGLPPAYVVVAEYDPLRDEGIAYAQRLEQAGVPVTFRHVEDGTHGFFTMINLLDQSIEEVRNVSRFIREAVGVPAQVAPAGVQEAGAP